ncbi:lipoyl synthase [bacterium]|nr:lipoyl synthase [bacterium]
MSKAIPIRKPEWLKVKAPGGQNFLEIKKVLAKHKLFTVCEEARCPNIGECWAGGTATFMLLGDTCTRGCKFCNVKTGNPRGWVDAAEPGKIASSVADMNLDYIVLTSVDRDDLEDQGAKHFSETVRLTKVLSPDLIVETLTPDWRGDEACIDTMASSKADVLAHNIETVERLQRQVRDPRCTYKQSMEVLEKYKRFATTRHSRTVVTKSSLMLGLGERDEEIIHTMKDLLNIGVEILTFGQYLQPTPRHLAVVDYVTPEKFSYWAKEGEAMGFKYVASGPLVRSSYKAGEYFIKKILRGEKSDGSILGPEQSKQRGQSVVSGTAV